MTGDGGCLSWALWTSSSRSEAADPFLLGLGEMKRWLASLEGSFGVKEWDRACTPEFKDSSAVIESVGRRLVVLPREAETGDARLDV